MSFLKSVKLNIATKLRDPSYREEFFRRTAKDEIAMQIRALRERRELRQIDVARATGMKQSAVSRIEQADYSGWTFSTLLRIAKALNARLRVNFEPAEVTIAAYEETEASEDHGLPDALQSVGQARAFWATNIDQQRLSLHDQLAKQPLGPFETKQCDQSQYVPVLGTIPRLARANRNVT